MEEMNFEMDKERILSMLKESLDRGTAVGIDAFDALGGDISITGVEDVDESDEDPVIILKGYDVNGYILKRNRIRLSEITKVYSFASSFENPYYKELTGVRFHRLV